MGQIGHVKEWAPPDVGSRGEPGIDCSSGSLLQFRQANRIGVPFAWSASPRYLPGRSAGERKTLTGFTNGEEEEMQLTKVVPFLVEDELLRLGAVFEKMANWQPFSITDGRLITGQNPASSTVAAEALMKLLGERSARASA
jgi:hypothetical protein